EGSKDWRWWSDPMPWYSASAIMYCRFKDGGQSPTPVWENVLLIEAPDEDTAWDLAERRARQDEGDASGSMTWDGRPAEWKLAGVRKLLSVAHDPLKETETLGHGDEVTFTEFILADMAAVQAMASGKAVTVEYSGERPPMTLAEAKDAAKRRNL